MTTRWRHSTMVKNLVVVECDDCGWSSPMIEMGKLDDVRNAHRASCQAAGR